jgi:hypothetical protein
MFQQNINLNSLSKALYNVSERVEIDFTQYDYKKNSEWVTFDQALSLKDIIQLLCAKLDFVNYYTTYSSIGSDDIEKLEGIGLTLESNLKKGTLDMLDLSVDEAFNIVNNSYDDQKKVR